MVQVHGSGYEPQCAYGDKQSVKDRDKVCCMRYIPSLLLYVPSLAGALSSRLGLTPVLHAHTTHPNLPTCFPAPRLGPGACILY